jgi:pantothenate kinase
MPPETLIRPTLAELVERARALVPPTAPSPAAEGGSVPDPRPRRRILGIAGPPGAGKSTLADAIVAALGPDAVLVPMDGFHLENDELDRIGLRERKGAPATFDAAGYAALLGRLRDAPEPVTRAPLFRRDLDRSIQDVIEIPAGVPLVITEGNYLLLGEGPWAAIRPLLDAAWYLAADETRVERLIARHVEHGKAPDDARDWVLRSDEANARIIEATRDRADLVVVGLPRA